MNEILKIINQEIKKELNNVNDSIGNNDISENLKFINSLNKLLLNSDKIDFFRNKYKILEENNIYTDSESKLRNLITYYTKRNYFSDAYIKKTKNDLLVHLDLVNHIKITNLDDSQIIKLKYTISKYIHLTLILKYFNGNIYLEEDRPKYTVNKYNILNFINNENGANIAHSELKIDELFLKEIKDFDFICSIDNLLFNNLEFIYNYMIINKKHKKEMLKSKNEFLAELRIKESVIF